MKSEDIYLVGYLTGMKLERGQILVILRQRAAALKLTDTYDHDFIQEAQQHFLTLFPQGLIPLLCRWTLTLSESFSKMVQEYYSPETHSFQKGVGAAVNMRFRRYLRQCRVANKDSSTIQGGESFSAVYLLSNKPSHRKATVEYMLHYWASLAADPADIRGLQGFLRRTVGYNDHVNRMVELIYNLIDDSSPYVRGRIIAVIIPNLLRYFEWLAKENPLDQSWSDIEASVR